MNLPNKLTLFRIFLVIPLILVLAAFTYLNSNNYLDIDIESNQQYYLYAAGFIFIVAMITDAIDGYLARKWKQVTTFGKLFDPLADKIIVTTSMIFLAVFQYTYIPVVIIFVIRDLIVDGSRNIAASNNIKVEASVWGKLKTIFQTIAIIILFFFIPLINKKKWWQVLLINIPMLLALVASIFSGIKYFMQIVPIINKSK